jgi:hypothetical protein
MQQCHKGPRPETRIIRQEDSEGPRRRTAAISEETRPEEATTGKHGKSWHSFQENYKIGDHQANGQIYCWVADDEELDLVEGSAPSEAEKKTALA